MNLTTHRQAYLDALLIRDVFGPGSREYFKAVVRLWSIEFALIRGAFKGYEATVHVTTQQIKKLLEGEWVRQ